GRRLRPLALPALRGTPNRDGSFTATIPEAYRTMFPQPLLKKFVNGYVVNRDVTPPEVRLRNGSFLQRTNPASYSADIHEYWWAASPEWQYDSERHALTMRNA